MATDQETDSLWNISVTNRSWVDMVEEEEIEMSKRSGQQDSPVKSGIVTSFKIETNNVSIVRDGVAEIVEKTKVETVSIADKMTPRIVASVITEEESCDVHDRSILSTISEESSDTTAPLQNVTQTYANILKNSPLCSSAVITVKNEIKPDVKKELSKDFLQEDISLTGHIEGFNLTSPCKSNQTGFKTPTKVLEVPGCRSSPRTLKRKILQEGSAKIPDEVLMPSPNKIPRSNDGRNNDVNSPNIFNSRGSTSGKRYSNDRASRKRPRDLHTPPSNRRHHRPPRELETNEEVLARRQKQIDYGKNTIGYERYTQLVPKDARKSIHPKTPPQHQKYSRRAWEGLVRIWRQRLHFWDPPSEGGGDPACLEADYSDMSDVSSTDGSLPSTPVQDLKRRQVYVSPLPGTSSSKLHRAEAAKSLASSIATSSSNSNGDKQAINDGDFDDQGCQPLSPE